MIVRVTGDGADVDEREDLARLEVQWLDGPLADGLGAMGRPGEDESHVWLDVEKLRAAADPGTPGWQERFSGMVSYAGGKGWLDSEGTALRAHVVRPASELE